MADPYLYSGSETLINLFDERSEQALEKIEADYTSLRLRQLLDNPLNSDFNFTLLCKTHKFIFQDIYEWAGKIRIINIEKPEAVLGGLSVEYSEIQNIKKDFSTACQKMKSLNWPALTLKQKAENFAQDLTALWKVHPFREGNTRAIICFCCDFAERQGFPLNRELFKDNSLYVRRALVASSAVFKEFGNLAKPQYLIDIIKEAIKTA
ncbi:MAG: Fic family protein [Candidatus Margulisbacteria bacterium]|jgi:cell filamentation protein|nr:Fic family protein [Candidatus Margulisiibacteriota bacterium]